METKTESVAVSENASASAVQENSTVAEVKAPEMPERAMEDPTPEKKPSARRTSRAKSKKTATAPLSETESPAEAEKQNKTEKEQPKSVSADKPVSAVEAPASEQKSEQSAKKTEKKPSRRKASASKEKSPSTEKTDPKQDQQPTPTAKSEADVAPAPSSEKAKEPKKKDPDTAEKEQAAAKKPTKKTSRPKSDSRKKAKTEAEAPVKEEPVQVEQTAPESTVEPTAPVVEERSVSEAPVEPAAPAVIEVAEEPTPAVEIIEQPEPATAAEVVEEPAHAAEPVSVSEPIATVVSVFERKESTDPGAQEIDVSGTPKDTFVFFSPSQLAQMEAEAKASAVSEVVVEKEEPTAAKVAPAVEEPEEVTPTVTVEEITEAPAEMPAEDVSAVEEPVQSVEEAPAPDMSRPIVTVSEVKETAADARSEKRAPRRSDPHERDVMDKERVYRNLFDVLTRSGEIERRTLIEETMKTIPLTDEERTDNHPTSLSNRVRSVIGSILAEQLASGKIVASGRKLTLPTVAVEEELVPNEEAMTALSTEVVMPIEIELEKGEVEAEPEIPEAPVAVDMPEAEPMREEAREEAVEEAPAVEIPAEEVPYEEEKRPEVSVREASVRRVRQPRGERVERRPAATVVTAQGPVAVLITEEELERVILNALRRNSATKNDLFAILKQTFVTPNRFSKDEEGRIYTVAGNVLQKLVNRGTLQNSDGRYLQKPSQRILNPGRAPGIYSTGNVEARFITELNRQSGDFFEQFAARLLEKYFEMSNVRVDASYVVGGSDDNGIDIMLETTDWLGYKERVFVQAKKRATQPVTLKEVREFYGALCAEEGTRGVFITTSSFCMEASKMIGKIRNLIAIDKRKLFALAEHCEVGLVRDENGRLLLDENLFLDYDV